MVAELFTKFCQKNCRSAWLQNRKQKGLISVRIYSKEGTFSTESKECKLAWDSWTKSLPVFLFSGIHHKEFVLSREWTEIFMLRFWDDSKHKGTDASFITTMKSCSYVPGCAWFFVRKLNHRYRPPNLLTWSSPLWLLSVREMQNGAWEMWKPSR